MPPVISGSVRRYPNRPIVEFENAAQEQMKITELRLVKLFSSKEKATAIGPSSAEDVAKRIEASSESSTVKASQISARTRPPITTHVLDVSSGSPAAGIEVLFRNVAGCKIWSSLWSVIFKYRQLGISGVFKYRFGWSERSAISDVVNPGIYKISFNTGKYCPESQVRQHFHVPVFAIFIQHISRKLERDVL